MYEFDDLKEIIHTGSISLWQWFKDFYKTDSFLYIDKRDMGPFLAMLTRKFINSILGVLGMKKK